jgi:hypothetical protein
VAPRAAAIVKRRWGLVLGGSHTQGALREEWALEWNAFGIRLGLVVKCRQAFSEIE